MVSLIVPVLLALLRLDGQMMDAQTTDGPQMMASLRLRDAK
jgi:hypothetical protein